MNGPTHHVKADDLIAEGEAVVREIRALRSYQKKNPSTEIHVQARQEARLDALGKQAMGIWAQAQVHATLALAAFAEEARS